MRSRGCRRSLSGGLGFLLLDGGRDGDQARRVDAAAMGVRRNGASPSQAVNVAQRSGGPTASAPPDGQSRTHEDAGGLRRISLHWSAQRASRRLGRSPGHRSTSTSLARTLPPLRICRSCHRSVSQRAQTSRAWETLEPWPRRPARSSRCPDPPGSPTTPATWTRSPCSPG